MLKTCNWFSRENAKSTNAKGRGEWGWLQKAIGSCLCLNNRMPGAPSTPLPVHSETNLKQLPMSANIISEKSQGEKPFKYEELETGQEIYSIFSKKKPSREKLRRGFNWIACYLDCKGSHKTAADRVSHNFSKRSEVSEHLFILWFLEWVTLRKWPIFKNLKANTPKLRNILSIIPTQNSPK